LSRKQGGVRFSSLDVKLSLKAGGVEIVAEGEARALAKEIPALRELLILAYSGLSVSESSSAPEVQEIGANASETPAIKVSRSTTENLRALFSTSWGKTPAD